MGRFPRVMPTNAVRERGHPGYHDADGISAACLLPPGASLAPPRRVPLDTRFRGYDKGASPNAVLSVSY